MKDPITYKNSGVDIDAGTEVLRRIKKLAKSTHIGVSLRHVETDTLRMIHNNTVPYNPP